jgi:hypothetical protein
MWVVLLGLIVFVVGLYDYGATFRFKGMYLSARGAAAFRNNFDTLMLLPPYSFGTPADYRTSTSYYTAHKTGAGFRLGYAGENWELAYSHANYRHNVPHGLLFRYLFEHGYIRAVYLGEFTHSNGWDPTSWQGTFQLSHSSTLNLIADLDLDYLIEGTYVTNGVTAVRGELSLLWNGFGLGVRQMLSTSVASVTEFSLMKKYSIARFGFHTEPGRNFYFSTMILF